MGALRGMRTGQVAPPSSRSEELGRNMLGNQGGCARLVSGDTQAPRPLQGLTCRS